MTRDELCKIRRYARKIRVGDQPKQRAWGEAAGVTVPEGAADLIIKRYLPGRIPGRKNRCEVLALGFSPLSIQSVC